MVAAGLALVWLRIGGLFVGTDVEVGVFPPAMDSALSTNVLAGVPAGAMATVPASIDSPAARKLANVNRPGPALVRSTPVALIAPVIERLLAASAMVISVSSANET